jgi:hypothetical protein
MSNKIEIEFSDTQEMKVISSTHLENDVYLVKFTLGTFYLKDGRWYYDIKLPREVTHMNTLNEISNAYNDFLKDTEYKGVKQ